MLNVRRVRQVILISSARRAPQIDLHHLMVPTTARMKSEQVNVHCEHDLNHHREVRKSKGLDMVFHAFKRTQGQLHFLL